METLRIRIPKLFYCEGSETCQAITRYPICNKCLAARVRQEMTTTTFTRKPNLIHRPPLGSQRRSSR